MNAGTGASASKRRAAHLAARFLETPLLANAKRLDQRPVALDVLLLQVVEQAPPLADEHQQTTTRVMVLGMDPEVLREIGDAFRQEGNLNLRRSCVGLAAGELLDDFCFLDYG